MSASRHPARYKEQVLVPLRLEMFLGEWLSHAWEERCQGVTFLFSQSHSPEKVNLNHRAHGGQLSACPVPSVRRGTWPAIGGPSSSGTLIREGSGALPGTPASSWPLRWAAHLWFRSARNSIGGWLDFPHLLLPFYRWTTRMRTQHKDLWLYQVSNRWKQDTVL